MTHSRTTLPQKRLALAVLALAVGCTNGTRPEVDGSTGGTSSSGDGDGDDQDNAVANNTYPSGGGTSPMGTGSVGVEAENSGGGSERSGSNESGSGGRTEGCARPARSGPYQITITSVSGPCVSPPSQNTTLVADPRPAAGYECALSETWTPDGCTLTRSSECNDEGNLTLLHWRSVSTPVDSGATILEGTLTMDEAQDRVICRGERTLRHFRAERPVAGASVCRQSCGKGEYCETGVRYAPDGTSTAHPTCRPFPSDCPKAEAPPLSDTAGIPSCECVRSHDPKAKECLIDPTGPFPMLFLTQKDEYNCPTSQLTTAPGHSLAIVKIDTLPESSRITLRNTTQEPLELRDLYVAGESGANADRYEALPNITLAPQQSTEILMSTVHFTGSYLAVYRNIRGPADLEAIGSDNKMVAFVQWLPSGGAPRAHVAVDAGLWSSVADTVPTQQYTAGTSRYLIAIGNLTTGAGFAAVNISQCHP